MQNVVGPRQELAAGDESCADQGLAVGDNVVIAIAKFLVLSRVGLEHVVPGLDARLEGKGDDALGTGVQLVCRLLDEGDLLVNLGQSLVAKGVGLLEIRSHELERAGEVGNEGLGKGLVGRVAELQRLLTVGVLLKAGDTVVDDGVVEEVLKSYCQYP